MSTIGTSVAPCLPRYGLTLLTEVQMRLRVFLRQSLFSLAGDGAHVPAGAMILDGTVVAGAGAEGGAGPASSLGLALTVHAWRDERGRELAGAPRTLVIPGAKIDHALVLAD
jgi:hypothetical protein